MSDYEKAQAIINFIDEVISSIDVDILEKNTVSIYELHQWVVNHCYGMYDIELDRIEKRWGEGVSVKCGKHQYDINLPANVIPICTALQKPIV